MTGRRLTESDVANYRRQLSDLVVDLLSDNGRGEISFLLGSVSPSEEDAEKADIYLAKIGEFYKIHQILRAGDDISTTYIDDSEKRDIHNLNLKLSDFRLGYLVNDIENHLDGLQALTLPSEPHFVSQDVAIEYIQKIDYANSLLSFLVFHDYIGVDYVPRPVRERMDNLKVHLIGYREELD